MFFSMNALTNVGLDLTRRSQFGFDGLEIHKSGLSTNPYLSYYSIDYFHFHFIYYVSFLVPVTGYVTLGAKRAPICT
jgi:hypothetical protein